MGMAASQARLLTITARLADNELRSQTINNAKMRLATQSSQASENYINALNNATLKFASYDEAGNAMSQDLTYNALTAYSSYNTQYGLINSAGQILVSESEAAMFTQANGNLNAYLLAHGLEYTTTYFDELGAIKNAVYPQPFDNISVEEMKTYYEQYGSYENSLEVENYTNNYGEFVNADLELEKATEEALLSYLLTNNTPNVTQDPTSGDFGITVVATPNTLANRVNAFKNYFYGTNNNTYNINGLYADQFISEVDKNSMKEIIDSISYGSFPYLDEDGNPKIGNDLKREKIQGVLVSENVDMSSEVESDANGNVLSTTYVLDGAVKITVDANGKVTEAVPLEDEESKNSSYALTGPLDAFGAIKINIDFEDFVNQLSYKETTYDEETDSNTYKERFMSLDKDENGNYKVKSTMLVKEAEAPEFFNSITNELLNEIIFKVNRENFARRIVEDPSFNIDSAQIIKSVGKTLGEVLNNYFGAKDRFLSNIFEGPLKDAEGNYVTKVEVDGVLYNSSKDYVEAAMRDGAIAFTTGEGEDAINHLVTPENLTNIDFVLQFLKAKGLKQSESFNTVIKEFLVEEIIAVYGEPKYAWVDQNDTANTGNADAKAQWYTNLFNRMNQGFKALENGLGASKEWMEYALESGIVTLEQVDKNFKWNGLDYRTCVKITEVTDEAAVAKAEAEYNRAMNDIEAKDNIFDMELKNIDTEHNALQTEYDVIKGVIDKNISRTFKFNQSA